MKKIKSFRPDRTPVGRTFNGRANVDALYDLTWNKYSREFLSINKQCYACGKESQVTDHIKAHKGDRKLFWKQDNCLPLCISCHNTVTTKFDRHPIQKYDDKLKWFAYARGLNGLSFSVKIVPMPREALLQSENKVESQKAF